MNDSNTPKLQNTPTSCPASIQRDLKAYSDGELSGLGKWRVARHVAHCDTCRNEVLWLKRFAQELRERKAETPRPELRARILANLPELPNAVRPVTTPRPLVLAPRYALGTALLLCVGLGGVFALKGVGLWQPHKTVENSTTVPPKPTFIREPKTEVSQVTLPDDPDHINQKASEIFQTKMQNIPLKPSVKIPPPSIDATEATVDTPVIRFVPTESAKSDAYLHQMTLAVQQVGGAVQKTPVTDKKEGGDTADTVLTIRVPAKRVEEMFHNVRRLGNFKKLPQPHSTETLIPSRPQMRVPFPSPREEDKNLVLTPDSKGFVTLHLEVKPKPTNAGK